MSNPYVLLAIVLAFLGAAGGGYYLGGKHKENAFLAQQQRDEQFVLRLESAVADAISTIKVKNVTIRQKAETITREVPVYTDCKHSPDGMRLVNEAIEGRPEAVAKSKLPTVDAP